MNVDLEQAKAVFLDALEKTSAEERSVFLDEVCGDDQALRSHVDLLLEAHQQPGSFLEKGALVPGPTVVQSSEQEIVEKGGTRIGPYKLLQQIGEGGMGVVYMAEQSAPVERRVALKIIKPGMDTRQVIARFEAERQALAMMDHPNIARILDAGITDDVREKGVRTNLCEAPEGPSRQIGPDPFSAGRPFFAMELVKGVPITQYCDEHKLTVRGRLELFAEICHAVQHAHQKGIIHRDIKPSNVLVAEYDDHAVPKIIDFGLAKAMQQRLTEKTMFTQMGQVVGTLEYMSPEQAKLNQLDIDTRSDIYSLGVLLYELLTGETPFDRKRLRSAAFDEILRILREEEPPRPSLKVDTSESLPLIAANRHVDPKKLSVLVRGELDWIVMKAMEKDRARRYETANGLAADIARYLNDEAVAACPPSAAYRFGKFARRNKVPLTISAAAALVLMLVAVGSFIAALRFEKLASDNAQLVTEKSGLAENLQTALAESQANLTRARDQEQKAKENLALATSEQQRAEGNLDLALAALDAVYLDAIGEEKLLGEPRSKPRSGTLAFSSSTHPPLTDLEKDLLKRGLTFYDQFAQQNATTTRAAVQTAEAYYRVGLLQKALGDFDSAESSLQAAIERFEKLTMERPDDWVGFRGLGEAKRAFGFVRKEWNASKTQCSAAIKAYTRAIELCPEDANLLHLRSRLHFYLSDFAAGVADLEGALDMDQDNVQYLMTALRRYKEESEFSAEFKGKTREVLERLATLAGDNPEAHLSLGRAYQYPLHDREKSLRHFNCAVELLPNSANAWANRSGMYQAFGEQERALSDANRALELDPSCTWAYTVRGLAYRDLGQPQKALAEFSRAMELNPLHGNLLKYRGGLLLKLGKYEAALDDLNLAVKKNPRSLWGRHRRAQALFHFGRYAESVADLNLAIERDPRNPDVRKDRAQALFHLGRYAEALADLNLAVELDPRNSFVRKRRAHALFHFGRYAEALADLKQALELNPKDTSTLVWIPPSDVARCPDENFKQGLLKLADTSVEHADVDKLPCYLRRAKLLRALGMHEQAEHDLAGASELATDDAKFQIKLAHHYREAGLEHQALTNFSKAIELDPSRAHHWNHRGMCYHRLGQHTKARDDYSAAIKRDPTVAAFWSNRALSQLNLQAYQQAVDDASKAIELKSTHALAHNWRAQAQVALERWPEAIADYTTLIELKPKNFEHVLKRGQARLAAGDEVGAEVDFKAYLQPLDQAVTENSDDWQVWNRRGVALTKLKHWDAAIADLAKAAALAPDQPEIHKNTATAFVNQERWKEAADALAKVVELGAKEWSPSYQLALCCLGAEDVDRYREVCRRMLEDGVDTEDALRASFTAWTCALAAGAIEDYQPLVDVASGAIEQAPDNHQFQNSLGAVLYRAGRYEEALERLTKLDRKNESNAKANSSPAYTWYFLAMTHQALGQTNEAQTMLARANEWTDKALSDENASPLWNRKLTLQLLQREANNLVRTQPNHASSEAGADDGQPQPDK